MVYTANAKDQLERKENKRTGTQRNYRKTKINTKNCAATSVIFWTRYEKRTTGKHRNNSKNKWKRKRGKPSIQYMDQIKKWTQQDSIESLMSKIYERTLLVAQVYWQGTQRRRRRSFTIIVKIYLFLFFNYWTTIPNKPKLHVLLIWFSSLFVSIFLEVSIGFLLHCSLKIVLKSEWNLCLTHIFQLLL